MSDDNFLSRWSRKKAASKATSEAGPDRPSADVVPAKAGTQFPAAPNADAVPAPDKGTRGQAPSGPQSSPPLPPVESLTIDSDFSAFMKSDVDPGLRRQALKTLLQDPQFNVMDGLDTYIADYSQPDPLPEGWLEKMNQVKHLGIFFEPAQAPEAVLGTPGEPVEKAMEEQPVEPPPAVEGSDTSGAQISPPQVGKSTPRREGDQDVLV